MQNRNDYGVWHGYSERVKKALIDEVRGRV